MSPFTPADRPDGSAPEVLLLAGTRPEAARLAPVAAALAARGRIAPVLVAAGADPFLIDEALESFGTPADVMLLLGEPPRRKVGLAAGLAVRLDELMADREPAAVLVTGGGIAAVVGAQVAFWNRIPVVYLEPGPEAPEQLCPFPDGGNRRVIGQLTSLFLRVSDAGAPLRPDAAASVGPDAITVGDTMATAPLADPGLARLAELAAAGLNRVAVLDAGTPAVVAAASDLLAAHADLHVVFLGDPAGREEPVLWSSDDPPGSDGAEHASSDDNRPADDDPADHGPAGDEPFGSGGGPAELFGEASERVMVLADAARPDVLGLLRIATVGATDRPSGYREALDFGLPTVLVDRTGAGEPAAGVVPDRADAVLAALTAVLDAHPGGIVRAVDHEAAYRVEHALAWMFGLASDPAGTGGRVDATPAPGGAGAVTGPARAGAVTGPVRAGASRVVDRSMVSWLPHHRR